MNFNNTFIKATPKAYSLLVASGLREYSVYKDRYFSHIYVSNNKIIMCNFEYIKVCNEIEVKYKELHIVNGQLSYDKPTETQQDFTDFEDYCVSNGLNPNEERNKLTEIKPTNANNAQIEINSMEDLNELLIVGEEDENIQMVNSNNLGNGSNNDNGTNNTSENTISIADEQGKVYKYEKPEFETTGLFIVKGVIVGALVEVDFIYAMKWRLDGTNEGIMKSQVYNLTPIQKKWYEDESNFPALVTKDGKTFQIWQNYFFERMVEPMEEDIANGWRLATPEEHASVHYEGK